MSTIEYKMNIIAWTVSQQPYFILFLNQMQPVGLMYAIHWIGSESPLPIHSADYVYNP